MTQFLSFIALGTILLAVFAFLILTCRTKMEMRAKGLSPDIEIHTTTPNKNQATSKEKCRIQSYGNDVNQIPEDKLSDFQWQLVVLKDGHFVLKSKQEYEIPNIFFDNIFRNSHIFLKGNPCEVVNRKCESTGFVEQQMNVIIKKIVDARISPNLLTSLYISKEAKRLQDIPCLTNLMKNVQTNINDKYFYMLFEDGGRPLQDFINDNLSLNAWRSIFFQVIFTIYVLNQRGIRHGDLHCGNILIEKNKDLEKITVNYFLTPTEYYQIPLYGYFVRIFDWDFGGFYQTDDIVQEVWTPKRGVKSCMQTNLCDKLSSCNKDSANLKADMFTFLTNANFQFQIELSKKIYPKTKQEEWFADFFRNIPDSPNLAFGYPYRLCQKNPQTLQCEGPLNPWDSEFPSMKEIFKRLEFPKQLLKGPIQGYNFGNMEWTDHMSDKMQID